MSRRASGGGRQAPRFAPVRECFQDLCASGRETGAALAVWYDGQPVVDLVGGSVAGEHAWTYGHLVGELVRRVDGRSVGRFLAEKIAGPWRLDGRSCSPAAPSTGSGCSVPTGYTFAYVTSRLVEHDRVGELVEALHTCL